MKTPLAFLILLLTFLTGCAEGPRAHGRIAVLTGQEPPDVWSVVSVVEESVDWTGDGFVVVVLEYPEDWLKRFKCTQDSEFLDAEAWQRRAPAMAKEYLNGEGSVCVNKVERGDRRRSGSSEYVFVQEENRVVVYQRVWW